MRTSSILTLALASTASVVAAVESSVVLFDLYGADVANGRDLVASLIASDKTASTYLVGCVATPTNKDGCLLDIPYTIIQGPSTVDLTITVPDYESRTLFSQAVNCVLTGTTRATCTVTANVPAETGTGVVSVSVLTTITGASITSLFQPFSVVTDGSEMLQGNEYAAATATPVQPITPTAPTTTSPSTKTALSSVAITSSPSVSGTGSITTITSAPSGLSTVSPSAVTAATSSRSTAGMARITGSAWVAGGLVAAAAVVGAM